MLQILSYDVCLLVMFMYTVLTTSRRWLLEEAQKLERQQKLQQQKLFELQQVQSTCGYICMHSLLLVNRA